MSANTKVLNGLGYVSLSSVIVSMARYIMLRDLGEPQHECFDAACVAFAGTATLGLMVLALFHFAARRGAGVTELNEGKGPASELTDPHTRSS